MQSVWLPGTAMSRTGRTIPDKEEDYIAGGALERLSRGIALLGGMLLVGVMLMTVISVLGRYLFNAPIPGDYEITELACAVAVFAFFPHCHARGGNIVVEFFTRKMSPRGKALLDAVHHGVFTVVAGLISWRLFVGGMHKFTDGETTLFLGIPLHWAYFPALIGAVLLVVVCVVMACRRLRASWQ